MNEAHPGRMAGKASSMSGPVWAVLWQWCSLSGGAASLASGNVLDARQQVPEPLEEDPRVEGLGRGNGDKHRVLVVPVVPDPSEQDHGVSLELEESILPELEERARALSEVARECQLEPTSPTSLIQSPLQALRSQQAHSFDLLLLPETVPGLVARF